MQGHQRNLQKVLPGNILIKDGLKRGNHTMRRKECTITTKDGIELYAQQIGQGPPLLLIHGAVVDSEFFTDFAELLATDHQVITYDRRGYGYSPLPVGKDGAEFQYPEDLNGKAYYTMQADDAFRVLTAFSDEPAIVLGCSAGAVVAMYLAEQHSEIIRKLFLHEPPAYILMRDHTEVWETIDKIKESIRAGKYNSALNRFLLFVTASRESKKEMTSHEIEAFMDNGLNFIRNEYLRTFTDDIFPEHLPEGTDALLLCGEETIRTGAPLATAAQRIAERLNLKEVWMPGSHNGVREDSAEFAAEFRRLLGGRSNRFPAGS